MPVCATPLTFGLEATHIGQVVGDAVMSIRLPGYCEGSLRQRLKLRL